MFLVVPFPEDIGTLVRTGHGNSHTFITREFTTALVEDREPAVDLYESLAMTAPAIASRATGS